MKIHGLQKLTLLDFPGRTACTVFTAGCDLRCPFCHNAALAFGDPGEPIGEEAFFSFLAKRTGMLDGVAITGGEPLLQPDLKDFILRVRSLGFLIKLDSNGFHPKALRALLEEGLLDYVAVDIKSSPAHYAAATGVEKDLAPLKETVAMLIGGNIPYEFRTTVVKGLHSPADIEGAARLIEGAEQYFLQSYVDPGFSEEKGFSAFSTEELEKMRQTAAAYVKFAGLRGV